MTIAGLLDPDFLLLTLIGALVLASAGLPRLIRELPLSVSMILVVLGGVVGLLEFVAPIPDLHEHPQITERVTEFLVIVSLMGAGLKLDTPLDWRRWNVTWRLLGIAKPLSIVATRLLRPSRECLDLAFESTRDGCERAELGYTVF